MNKRTISRYWIAALVTMITGTILIAASRLALLAHLERITPGTVNNLMPDGYARAMVTLILLGGILTGTGIGMQIGTWIGAVSNTRHLKGKKWFHALLWTGIVGIVTAPLFGIGVLISANAMIAYMVGGPDAMTPAS